MEAHPEFILPAGDYLIIDPCYVYDGARWQTLVDALFQGVDLQHIVTDPITGCRFAYSSTATGDGVYADDEGHLYGVDTGGIACLPLAMIDATVLVSLPERDRSRDKACSGRLVTFPDAWRFVPCDDDGVIRFGPITINTGSTREEEEDATGEQDGW